MTLFLTGGYGPDGGGEARGIGLVGDDGFLGTVAEVASPSWIVRSGDRLYAVAESAGTVHSWRFDGSSLEADDPVDAGGELPCHLSVVAGALLVSCYGDGVLTRVPLDPEGVVAGPGEVILRPDGSGPHPDQSRARIHATVELPDGAVLAADLGSDALHRLAPDGATTFSALPGGTGPRDLAVLGDGRILVLGELSCSLLLLDPEGRVEHGIGLPGAEAGDHAAALAITRRGDRLRVHSGLRGSNRIAAVDLPDAGAPTAVAWAATGGDGPRHLVVDGGVVRIANQLSSTVSVLDAESLRPVASPQAVPSPTQLVPVTDDWTALIR